MEITVEILEKVESPPPKIDCFEIVFEYMHGDADFYEKDSIVLAKNELFPFLHFISWCEKNQDKPGGIEKYPPYLDWAQTTEPNVFPSEYEDVCRFIENIPYDKTTSILDSLASVSVDDYFYYDNLGQKYKVKLSYEQDK